jgi:hypothetical protein
LLYSFRPAESSGCSPRNIYSSALHLLLQALVPGGQHSINESFQDSVYFWIFGWVQVVDVAGESYCPVISEENVGW